MSRRPPYVLAPELVPENLLAGVRDSALDYFDKHRIRLNSSQMACVNHLEPARLDGELALAIARRLDSHVRELRDCGDHSTARSPWQMPVGPPRDAVKQDVRKR